MSAAPNAFQDIGEHRGHPVVRGWYRHRRVVVLALGLLGVALIGASFFVPWWSFDLKAPQYPQGLELVVLLTGVTGDVAEIDIINHYIGMHSLAHAATWERLWASRLIAALCVMVLGALFLAGRRLGALAAVLGAMLPLGFVADLSYWLYRMGHDLDPTAAVNIKPFMPTLLGGGRIGQFVTQAWPLEGFGLAIAGTVLLGIAVWRRAAVCRLCPLAEHCNAICPHGFIAVKP